VRGGSPFAAINARRREMDRSSEAGPERARFTANAVVLFPTSGRREHNRVGALGRSPYEWGPDQRAGASIQIGELHAIAGRRW